MRNLIHRVVERRDRADHAKQRIALGIDAALTAVRGDIAGKDLAIVVQYRIGAERENVAYAPSLVTAVLAAQSGFAGDQFADFVAARDDDCGGALKDAMAFVARQARLVRQGRGKGVAYVIDAGFAHRSDAGAGKRVADFDDVVRSTYALGLVAKIHGIAPG